MTDLADARARAKLADDLLPDVTAIANPMVREQYLERLAGLSRMDPVVLRGQARRAARSKPQIGRAPSTPPKAEQPRDRREEFVLALLLRYPGLREEGLGLDRELFVGQDIRTAFDAWRTYMDPEVVREHVVEELAPLIDQLALLPMPPFGEEGAPFALRDAVLRLARTRLQERKRALGATLAEIEERVEPSRVADAAAEYTENGTLQDEELIEEAARYLEDARAGAELHEVESALRRHAVGAPLGTTQDHEDR
jgi:DNA primase